MHYFNIFSVQTAELNLFPPNMYVYIEGCACVCASHFSCVHLFVTLWTTACQAPLSIDSPGKNTGVGCQVLLQEIFLT